MIYVKHDMEKNYIAAINSRSYPLAMDILASEIADWIVSDPETFRDGLSSAGVAISPGAGVSALADSYISNLTNDRLKNVTVNHFVQGSKGGANYGKALAKGVTALASSKGDKEKDYCKIIKDRVGSFSKKMQGIAAADGSGDATPKKPQEGLVLRGTIAWITVGLALYGAYNLYKLVSANWNNGKLPGHIPNAGTAGAGMAAAGTPAPTGAAVPAAIPAPIVL